MLHATRTPEILGKLFTGWPPQAVLLDAAWPARHDRDVTTPTAIVLVVGGDGQHGIGAAPEVPAGAVVVAADSGLHLAVALGLAVDHVVGDLDSVDPAVLEAAEAAGATVHRHPADKDATDSALAVDLVLDLAAAATATAAAGTGSAGTDGAAVTLLVLGRGGGRLDHLLADLLALAAPSLAGLEVTARLGPATVTVVRPGRPRSITGRTGEQVSLLPVHGRVRGVTTSGLRWALVDADLVAGTTRAVSNELMRPAAEVALGEGVLLVVQPGTLAAPIDQRLTPYDPTPLDPLDRT